MEAQVHELETLGQTNHGHCHAGIETFSARKTMDGSLSRDARPRALDVPSIQLCVESFRAGGRPNGSLRQSLSFLRTEIRVFHGLRRRVHTVVSRRHPGKEAALLL